MEGELLAKMIEREIVLEIVPNVQASPCPALGRGEGVEAVAQGQVVLEQGPGEVEAWMKVQAKVDERVLA
jgi:hypothetical protein